MRKDRQHELLAGRMPQHISQMYKNNDIYGAFTLLGETFWFRTTLVLLGDPTKKRVHVSCTSMNIRRASSSCLAFGKFHGYGLAACQALRW